AAAKYLGTSRDVLYRPRGGQTVKDVSCARILSAVISLVAIDSPGSAILVKSSDHRGVTRDCWVDEEVTRPRVGSFQICLLSPSAARAHKDVSRARIDSAVIGLVPVNAGGSAVFAISSDHYGVPRDRDGDTEEIIRSSVGSFQIRLLRPGAARAHKDVSCARINSAVVSLVAIDTAGGAVLSISSDYYGIARDRYGGTEQIIYARVGSFQIRLLHPGAARAHKDVSCARTGSAVIRLIAVDSGSGAILVKSSNHHRVARDRYGATEEITRPRVGSFQIRL